MAAAAAKRCARWPRPCATRPASSPWRSGTAERQAWVAGRRQRPVRRTRHAGFARSADWRTEADRIQCGASRPLASEPRTAEMSFEKTPAGWTGTPAPSKPPSFQLPPAAWTRTATLHVRPRRRVSPFAPERKYTPCDASSAAVRAARPPGLRAQRGRAGHLPRRRQPRHGRCLHRQRRARAAWPR